MCVVYLTQLDKLHGRKRAIDKLRKAANLKSTRRLVVLDNGDEFEFWSTPLTMAQREKANRDAKSDDINQFALQLLLTKATDESGSRLFSPGDLAVLKNEVRDDDLQKLMLAVIQLRKRRRKRSISKALEAELEAG